MPGAPSTSETGAVGDPITDLDDLLASLAPQVREGEFVVATVEPDGGNGVGGLTPLATVLEDEGLTVVLERAAADAAGVAYDFVAAWITLTVHSSLEAVGMTAAFAAALAAEGIPANVLAGHHHDHLLVPVDRRDDAVAALRRLAAGAG